MIHIQLPYEMVMIHNDFMINVYAILSCETSTVGLACDCDTIGFISRLYYEIQIDLPSL